MIFFLALLHLETQSFYLFIIILNQNQIHLFFLRGRTSMNNLILVAPTNGLAQLIHVPAHLLCTHTVGKFLQDFQHILRSTTSIRFKVLKDRKKRNTL